MPCTRSTTSSAPSRKPRPATLADFSREVALILQQEESLHRRRVRARIRRRLLDYQKRLAHKPA